MKEDNEQNKTGITLKEIFFYLFFALMFGMRMWGVYEGKTLYAPLICIGMIFWLVSLLMTEHTFFECIWMFLLLLLAGLVYLNSGEKGLIFYFALLVGVKDISLKKLFKVGIIAGGSGLIVLGFLSAFGFVEDVVYIQDRRFLGDILRHALGTPHPNTLATSFMVITVMILYVIGHKDKVVVWKATILLFAISVYVYFYAQSRTGILGTTCILLLNIIYTYRKKVGIAEILILIISVPILLIGQILVPAFASDELLEIVKKIDGSLYIRFHLGQHYLNSYNITAFGQRFNKPDEILYGIDLSNLYLLLQLGVVAFIFIVFMWILLIIDEVKENKTQELIIVFAFLVMGITDPFLYNISFKNIAFAFIGVTIFKYSDLVTEQLPELFSGKMQLIKVGDKAIPIKRTILKSMGNIIKSGNEECSKRHRQISFLIILLVFVAVLIGYYVTPSASYAVLDRNTREHYLIGNMNGRTYTSQEIAEIKKEGNIVINYSGEDEVMYTYYSDADNPIEGGLYAPNLARVEKIRFWLSVFVWGTAVIMTVYLSIMKGVIHH